MKKRRLLAIILVLVLGAAAAYHGSRHVSTSAAAGVGLEGESPPAVAPRTTLRIGTFNIHGGKGRDGIRDLDRTAETLAGLDFVALNEVHGPRLGRSGNQAQLLGTRLSQSWLFAPASRTWYCFESGNGLVSSLPVRCWQRIPLPRQFDRSQRNAVLVDLRHGERTVHVLLTHVVRRDDRERQIQLRTVIALFLALAEPAVLLGDLNSTADDPQIRQLAATRGVVDALSSGIGPKADSLIDRIFVRGLRPVHAEIRDYGASDHPLVWAEVQ